MTTQDAMYGIDACLGLEVIRPGQSGYQEAASTFFARGAPDMVVRPRDAGEVATAIQHARHAGLTISVRSGGHSGAGLSTHTDGMVIDLAHLNRVDVIDRADRLVRVGAGATWGEVAAALQPHGLGVTAGDTKDVGVGGLALGGGIGWLVRRDGLTIDSVVGASVVTADGRQLRADSDCHPELFWGLRGGGGNLGLVVSLDLVAAPVTSVHFGSIMFTPHDVGALVRGWRDLMREAGDSLTTTLMLPPAVPNEAAAVGLQICLADPDEATARAVLAPFRALATVVSDTVRATPYADVLEEAHAPEGVRMLGRNALVPELCDALIERLVCEQAHGGVAFALRGLGGAFARVAPDTTAFAHRDAEVMVVAGMFLPPEASDDRVEVTLARWAQVTAYGTGAYAGFLSSADSDAVAEVFPSPTYDRLAAAKREYDPQNVFRRNHNVPPAVAKRSTS